MAHVSIFIPHHANRSLLVPLFNSLENLNFPREQYQLILVDNNSTDGSKELVRKRFPAVKIIENQQNLGFAPALNQAVKTANSEWVCFLNNDIHVNPDWLTNLMYAAKHIDAPCFASRILDWEGKVTTFAGGTVNWFGKGFEETEIIQDSPYEIFFACGCGILIKRKLFQEIGGFDENYFMLFEDVDLGWRLRLMNHPIFLVTDAFIMHKAHTSLKKVPYAQKALYYERNSLASLYKNLEPDSLSILLPLALQEAQLRAKAIGGLGVPVRYSNDGLAILQAVQNFFTNRNLWREKRKWVQSQRKVSDQEIFNRFFHNPAKIWAYHEGHYIRLHEPEIHTALMEIYQTANNKIIAK